MRRTKLVVLATAYLVCVGLRAPVMAHGLIESTSPAKGSRIERVPNKVSVTLTEAPSDARLVVRDGCERKVNGKARVAGALVSAGVSDGEPGKWSVQLKAVSNVDGHLSKGRFSFVVAGKADCDRETDEEQPSPPQTTPSRSPTETNPEPSEGSTDERTQDTSESDQGAPVAAVILGAGGLAVALALGFVFRRRKGGA